MKKFVFLFCLLPLFLCGCWDQEVFEENAIILGAGVEKNPDNDYHFTFASGTGANSEEALSIITSDANIFSDAITKTNKESNHTLKSGKIQTIVFSEEVAKEGYIAKIDSHEIEKVNRFLSDYTVSEDSPEEVFNTINQMSIGEDSLSYLDNILKTAAQTGFCPDVAYYDYDIDFLNPTIDPILPLIAIEEDKIVVKGSALFKNKDMIGKISTQDSIFVTLITNNTSSFTYIIDTPKTIDGETEVVFQTNHCTGTVKTDTAGDKLKITMELNIKGYFDKIVWTELIKKFGNKGVNDLVENYFHTNIQRVVAMLQDYETDPFNIQGLVRGFHNDFYKTHDFRKAYKNADVIVKTKIKIENQENPKDD